MKQSRSGKFSSIDQSKKLHSYRPKDSSRSNTDDIDEEIPEEDIQSEEGESSIKESIIQSKTD